MLIIKVDIRDYGLRPRAYKCPMINVISFSVTKIHLTPLSPLKINTSQDLHLGLASLTFANIFNMWYFPQKKKKKCEPSFQFIVLISMVGTPSIT